MRLNKKRLAAVMMSAVMAASMVPTTVFAEGELVPVTASAVTYTVDPNSFEWGEDGTVTWKELPSDAEANVKVQTGKADKINNEATCTTPASYQWKIKVPLDGKEYYSREYVTDPARGHDFTNAKWQVESVESATCDKEGVVHLYRVCDRCQGKLEGGKELKDEPSAALGHTLESKVTYSTEKEGCFNTETTSPDVKPTLVKKDQAGAYAEITTKTCKVCGEKKDYVKIIELEAETTKTTEVFSQDSNIKTNIVGKDYSDLDLSKVELVDCTKKGTFVIVERDKDGNIVSQKTITIDAPHHVAGQTKAVGKTDKDKKLLVEKYDANGKLKTVTTNSCIQTAEYYEVVYCTSCEKEISRSELKVAQPAGTHNANLAAANVVNTLKNAKDKDGYVAKDDYLKFLKDAKDYKDSIKYETTVDCEKGGTVTITYLCSVCGEDAGMEAVSAKVKPFKHEGDNAKTENKVEATCTKEGSFDAVVYCKNCNKELSRTPKTIAKANHTFATDGSQYGASFIGNVVVDLDGESLELKGKKAEIWGYDLKHLSVTAKGIKTCKVCGTTVNFNYPDEGQKDLTIKLVDIVKEDGKGNPGTITLNASYTVSVDKKDKTISTGDVKFNYFSNMAAYLNRDPEKDPVNGLHLDKDGVWRYYVNGEFQEDYVGIVEFNGGEFFVANGVKCSEANGLNLNADDGKWYFLSQGQIQRADGFAEYDGAWFMLKNGELDLNANGLYDYDGGKFLFAAGKLQNQVNGLWQGADGTWYFLAQGQLQNYTGTTVYDGKTFELKDGKLVA